MVGFCHLSSRATEKPPAIEFAYFLSLPQLRRIYLEDYQHISDPEYVILKLISCSLEETVPFVQTLTGEPDKLSKDMLEFIETVLVYKLPHLSREEIRIMLALNDVQLKQTRFYQEIAAEVMQLGKLEGMQQGIEEGTLKGEIQILSRLLSKRFGALPAWAQQQLAAADINQLELWGDRILDAETLADVFA